MKISRFTEEEIIGILREREASQKTADVCSRRGIGGATFYKRKAKFGGLEVSDGKWLRALEDENATLRCYTVFRIVESRRPIKGRYQQAEYE
jgi:putative transposase